MGASDKKPKITHIALKVEDADKAAKFYQEVFGFVPTDTRRDGDHVSVHLTDGEFDLAMVSFDTEEDSVMAKIVGTGPCIHHFGIDVDDMDSMISKIKELGGEILTDPSNPGSTTVKFRVPGGGGITEIAPVDWHARKVGT